MRNGLPQATQGPTPNLYWRSVTLEELRSHSLYTGLPEAPPSLQPAMYRYIRQGSPLWSALHQGVLSGSSINAVLGLYEPLAAKKLGIPGGYVRHDKLLAAVRNLQQPVYVPSMADLANLNCSWVPQPPHSQQLSASTEASAQQQAAGSSAATAGTGIRAGSSRRKRGEKRGSSSGQPAGQVLLAKPFSKAAAVRFGSVERELAAYRSNVCAQKAIQGIGSIRCKWGTVQEAAALFEAMHALPGGSLEEVGLCMVEPDTLCSRYGYGPGRLPPMGASPDGLMRQRRPSAAASALTALRGAFDGLAIRDCSGAVLEMEVVEVKNACPYRQVSAVTKKGRVRPSYILADPGPAQKVNRNWVAQLQLEMLAAPADSALVISRSASKGLTVFRMWRDEEFIRDMLHFVSRVYTEHVLPDWPPPVNIFWGLPEYEQFLDRTNALANGATIVTQVPAAAVQRSSGSDQRAFL